MGGKKPGCPKLNEVSASGGMLPLRSDSEGCRNSERTYRL